MKEQEFRIGNLVKLPNKKYSKIEFVGNVEGNCNLVNGYDINLCKPIPLTEEWLVKFGLLKRGILFEKEKNSKFAVKLWGVGKPGLFLIFWGENRLPDIEPVYVHQLQNLYFALTGEELTIKE